MLLTVGVALVLSSSLADSTRGRTAATYYVANDGSDANDGTSPATAWRTIARVNAEQLAPGDAVLFRRGDHWREQLIPHRGDESGYVTYGAYGTGPKPLLMGSIAKNDLADWRHEGDHIWSTVEAASPKTSTLSVDVGNVILDRGASCWVKVWNESDLQAPGQFWYDEERHLLKVFSTENPATRHRDIECALRRHIIDQSGAHHVIYENLHLTNGGAHGIGGGATHHIIVRDCDLSFIGGGDQYGGDRTVRFGNGVEFWADAHDNLVERCRLWEIYDAALTNQNNAPNVRQFNITYRNNLIWNCEYSFEYWNRPQNSQTHNIRFENNTCVNAGHGWGHTQRPDPSGRHLCFYSSPAQADDIFVRNNIFFEARGNAFYAPAWEAAALAALILDHNCWYQPSGEMILLAQAAYTMAQFPEYQAQQKKETHSLVASPLFADAAGLDFRLTADSPCVDAGMPVGIHADLVGTPIPQGAQPDIGAYEFPQPSRTG